MAYIKETGNTNRKGVLGLWSCDNDKDGSYFVRYEKFTGYIKGNSKSIISKIKNGTIGDLIVTCKMYSDEQTYFKFSEEYKLSNLVKYLMC